MKLIRLPALALAAVLLCGCSAGVPEGTTIASVSSLPTGAETEPSTAAAQAAPDGQKEPQETVASEPAESAAAENMDYESQIQLIADNFETWAAQQEQDWWGYAVTDLNRDGRLEIVSSETHGTGLFTTTRVWEVNVTGDGLTLLTPDWEWGDTPVLTDENLTCYYNEAQDTYHYIQETMNRDGAAHYYESTMAVTLEYGRLNRTLLATRETVYEGTSVGEITCADGNGNAISEAEYTAIADTTFAGMTKSSVKIKWINTPAQPVTIDQLMDSWRGF